ncbi:hypothetical protein O7635_26915 [Asanoa sp. WMMD1127]|uniref:MXAN_6230/SCO0854 family RING domain-containing protein n=1 Tax=Asanoa sp. WMMD1127 TaxID=3016107 RepID=UPI002416CB83|nr:MXAN_6230/SCO0854 family RING domain-containing protein [Asanoa sp. WMMD1127]MDG4825495.1 hypothetical protein [Asanoa sp. WMMD1127]
MDPLAGVLLRQTGRVAVVSAGATPPDGSAWVAALEADLAGRGWLLRDDLRAAAAALPSAIRVRWADWLLAAVDELAGADRTMVPLYRTFPDTPRDVDKLFVQRLLVHLFAVPGAPCVLCGRDDGGAPLDPCGHPVCPACFPPERYSACPVCGRRLAADNTYLPVTPPAAPRARRLDERPPLPLRLAGLEPDPHAAAVRLRDEFVARPGALSEADRADLEVLVTATAKGRLDWLPEVVPARETLALVTAWALHATALTPAFPGLVAEAGRRWTTATDVARTLWAYSGGDPGLVLPRRADDTGPGTAWRPVQEPVVTVPEVRVRALARPLRRAALTFLDRCGAAGAAEDLQRHPTVWKRLGERLHPFERVASRPAAALAFAALRGTRTAPDSHLAVAIEEACAREPRHLLLINHADGTVGVRLRTHAALVEAAFAAGDVARAAELLTERPGQLWRRLDHLLRAAGEDPVARAAVDAAMRATVPAAGAAVLTAAAAELAGRAETVPATAEELAATARARTAARAHRAAVAAAIPAFTENVGTLLDAAVRRLRGGPTRPPTGSPPVADDAPLPGIVGGRPGPGMPRRVFFPRGSVVTTWTEPERRRPIPADAIAATRALVDGELSARAGRHERFDVAVLDAALAGMPAPMRERAASAQLAGWPRGGVRPLPPGQVLRLFLHWTEPAGTRVDLDLSCAFFDRDWRRLGQCDYEQLRFRGDAAVHSGDLTSAPAPLGATEFLDLAVDRLAVTGVRYAVPVVLSYNAVPFEALGDAFAGLMVPPPGGGLFDAAGVAQRFDLQGNARMLLPMVIDLPARRLLWTDLTLPGRGYGHSVGRHGDQLARAAADQWIHFLGGHRATLLDLLAFHAAGRADRILVGHADGTWTQVPADPAAVRAAAAASTGGLAPDLSGRTVLAGALDVDGLDRLVPWAVGAGSTALTVTGSAGDPWTPRRAEYLLGDLRAG